MIYRLKLILDMLNQQIKQNVIMVKETIACTLEIPTQQK